MAPKQRKTRHRPQKATSTTPNSASTKWPPRAVRHLRTQLNLTQEDFAEALGTTRQTIINWERGHQTPKKMASRLLSALERQAERGEWGSGEEEVAVALRLTKLVLQTEDPEATARALLRIARRRRAKAAE